MSPVLLWTGSSGISPIRLPVAAKSTSHRCSAWREKTAKLMPSGIMVAPGCMGEPGEISKAHFGESETFFIFCLKGKTTSAGRFQKLFQPASQKKMMRTQMMPVVLRFFRCAIPIIIVVCGHECIGSLCLLQENFAAVIEEKST
jgi:hypothetical protein